MANILLFGATGFTGRQVAKELDRRGASYILAGRNESRLQELASSLGGSPEIRVARADDPESIGRALHGVDLVINTVGPFSDLGEEVVRCALSRGVHYVDTTGEQAFIHRMETKYHELASRQDVVLCCALAFEYALAECVSAVAAQSLQGRVDLLETFYRTGRGGVSRGTAKSIVRAMGSPMLAWKGARLVKENVANVTTEVTFAGEERYRQATSFGGGTPLHARHYGEIREARSFLVMNEDVIRKLKKLRHARGLLGFGLTQLVADRLIDWRLGDDGPNTADTSFHVAARARRAGLNSQVWVSGKDPYRVTAFIAVEGAMRIVAGEQRQSGAFAIASILDPETFLTALEQGGMTWSTSHG